MLTYKQALCMMPCSVLLSNKSNNIDSPCTVLSIKQSLSCSEVKMKMNYTKPSKSI